MTRYALVTGAASGLGRAFCLQLAREGWHTAVADIDISGSERTLREIEEAGGSGQVELLDVASAAAWQTVCTRLQSQWPRLDLLVNNAAVLTSGNVGEIDLPIIERLVATNLLGTYYGCHVMIPWLKAGSDVQRNGPRQEFSPHIINIASIFAYYSPPGFAAYNLAKAGVVSLSETLYSELRPHHVGVTVVCPPVMATSLFDHATFRDDVYRQLCQQAAVAAPFTPEEVATQALAGARRGQLYVMIGRQARSNWRWKRLMPTSFLKFIARHTHQKLADAEEDLSQSR
jgi:NAD(P)-dependent dehydrogenase (short-subunit alcohol dehydrogenase family)